MKRMIDLRLYRENQKFISLKKFTQQNETFNRSLINWSRRQCPITLSQT